MITLEQGVEMVWHALKDAIGGEIYVRKIPSMGILDIAKAVSPDAEHEFIGIRPGEKIHEQMISVEESPHTFDYGWYFAILPSIHRWSSDPDRIRNGERVEDGFRYASDTNDRWMTIEDLRAWLADPRRLGTSSSA
jgi:FlaA1/EpsC-like NDP-sugar epimerase